MNHTKSNNKHHKNTHKNNTNINPKKSNTKKYKNNIKTQIIDGKTYYIKKIKNILVKYTKSTRKSKKWMTISPTGKILHWGSPTMEDYTQHHDKIRRKYYRIRAKGAKMKDGTPAYTVPWTPAWLAYWVTW